MLEVTDLHVSFDTPSGPVFAVNGVNLTIGHGETLAILGESGCGKTATAKTISGILECPPGRVRKGSISFQGRELLEMRGRERRSLMGKEIAWIPQDPLSALDPSFRIGFQIRETLLTHADVTAKEADERVIDALADVALPNPERLVTSYPHELSGGMRQRVLIAMAIVLRPTLLIADEPTTALDVTVQAENVMLLKRLQEEHHMGVMLITHDCALAAAVADRVGIMYAGQIVEDGRAADVFSRPAHPYTRGLLRSTPSLALGMSVSPIPGAPPKLRSEPGACAYVPRCTYAVSKCETAVPPAVGCGHDHRSACFRHDVVQAEPPILARQLS